MTTGAAGTFQVRDPSDSIVPGVISWPSGPNTAVFTPDDPLNYNKVYTVTLTTGIEDEETTRLTAEKVWSFTTFGAFPEPIAIRNRIDATNDHTLIFIPEPPAGANDRVTVQVFTATGKRVDTLVSAERYSEHRGRPAAALVREERTRRRPRPGHLLRQDQRHQVGADAEGHGRPVTRSA